MYHVRYIMHYGATINRCLRKPHVASLPHPSSLHPSAHSSLPNRAARGLRTPSKLARSQAARRFPPSSLIATSQHALPTGIPPSQSCYPWPPYPRQNRHVPRPPVASRSHPSSLRPSTPCPLDHNSVRPSCCYLLWDPIDTHYFYSPSRNLTCKPTFKGVLCGLSY